MFGGWRERLNHTTQTSTSQKLYILWRGRWASSNVPKLILKSFWVVIVSQRQNERDAERVSDWKVWFAASGNGCILKHSALLPQPHNVLYYSTSVEHMLVFKFKPTIPIDLCTLYGGLCRCYAVCWGLMPWLLADLRWLSFCGQLQGAVS